MTLYEIDQNIMALINEYGEITNPEAFDELQISRTEKIEGIACWIKTLLPMRLQSKRRKKR